MKPTNAHRRAAFGSLLPTRHGLGALLTHWRRHIRTRKQLKHLDARMLRDVGITREEADAEASKHFWDL